VLSVPPTFTRLPQTGLVAVDFGPSSVRAALAALLVLDAHGTLVVTHILPQLMSPAALSAPPSDDPAAEVHELFDRLRTELAPYVPEGVHLETRVVTGDPVDEILTSAEHVTADLLAVGTRGPGVFARMLIGSVADSVIHAAEQTVLAVPPSPPAEAFELWRRVLGVATSEHSQEWVAALDAFTRRNAGRDVMLEVSDPERGARLTGHGYALGGVTYEPASRELEIMVGDPSRPLRHLTRSVRHPDSITMTASSGGRGEVLDIRHGRGHTLVAVPHADPGSHPG
jgi:nucleotide-binding universal stress UspA family protein